MQLKLEIIKRKSLGKEIMCTDHSVVQTINL